MKVLDCIAEQDRTNGESLYLVRQGLFFHAFGHAAVAFQPATGYRVRNVPFHGSTIEQLGIPADIIVCALERFEETYPDCHIEEQDVHYHITLTAEQAAALPYEHNPEPLYVATRRNTGSEESPIISRLRALDISSITPIQAINILSEMKALVSRS